eukprot:2162151-Amphidinium_carterae.1
MELPHSQDLSSFAVWCKFCFAIRLKSSVEPQAVLDRLVEFIAEPRARACCHGWVLRDIAMATVKPRSTKTTTAMKWKCGRCLY